MTSVTAVMLQTEQVVVQVVLFFLGGGGWGVGRGTGFMVLVIPCTSRVVTRVSSDFRLRCDSLETKTIRP